MESSKTYLMIVTVRYYRVGERTVALESAFAEHLKLLKAKISPVFSQFLIGALEMDAEKYETEKPGLAIINERKEEIMFKSLCSKDLSSSIRRFRQLFTISGRLKDLVTVDVKQVVAFS